MATPDNPYLPSIGLEANVAALHLTIELSTGVKTRLRYGEIMGLRRKDFALRDRKVKIDRVHPKFDGDPKAPSGRTVSLPAFLVHEVKAHLAEFVQPEPMPTCS